MPAHGARTRTRRVEQNDVEQRRSSALIERLQHAPQIGRIARERLNVVEARRAQALEVLRALLLERSTAT